MPDALLLNRPEEPLDYVVLLQRIGSSIVGLPSNDRIFVKPINVFNEKRAVCQVGEKRGEEVRIRCRLYGKDC